MDLEIYNTGPLLLYFMHKKVTNSLKYWMMEKGDAKVAPESQLSRPNPSQAGHQGRSHRLQVEGPKEGVPQLAQHSASRVDCRRSLQVQPLLVARGGGRQVNGQQLELILALHTEHTRSLYDFTGRE